MYIEEWQRNAMDRLVAERIEAEKNIQKRREEIAKLQELAEKKKKNIERNLWIYK